MTRIGIQIGTVKKEGHRVRLLDLGAASPAVVSGTIAKPLVLSVAAPVLYFRVLGPDVRPALLIPGPGAFGKIAGGHGQLG